MLIGLVCAAVVMGLLFPETAFGALLRRWLVVLPAEKLSRLTLGRLVFGLLVLVFIAGVIALAKTDGLIVIAQGIPEVASWFAVFDIATYVDVIALTLLLGASVRFRAVSEAMRSAAARARQWGRRCGAILRRASILFARSRARRTRPSVTRPKRDEGEDRPAPVFAFA